MTHDLAWPGSDPARPTPGTPPTPPTRLRLVQPGDLSAAARRRAYAHATAAAANRLRLKTWASVGSVLVLFGSAITAMIWAFLAIPNTALP